MKPTREAAMAAFRQELAARELAHPAREPRGARHLGILSGRHLELVTAARTNPA
jgi:hypothetical protein